MSEDKQVSSEYLKRTCLICGCHTDQTINIYEPRSGPNIVKLIQAKFKFQPLNEDRYLCFSCNNWLVNWHSLQSVNSNDAENSSNVNNSSHMLHDKINTNAGRCAGDDNDVTALALGGSQQRPQTLKTRPVATVRPRQLAAEQQTAAASTPAVEAQPAALGSRQRPSFGYGKRVFRHGQQLHRRINEHKLLRQCSMCGSGILLRLLGSSSGSLNLAKLQRAKYTCCRKCRDIMHWRAPPLRSLPAAAAQKSSRVVNSNVSARRSTHSNNQSNHNTNHNNNNNNSSRQNYQKPRVDGRVVSMFRRLGTTLCRESQLATATSLPPPPIMSPAKQRPRWTRTIDDDEILLEFDTAISEVLPVVTAASTARRKLTYTITDADGDADADADSDADAVNAEQQQQEQQQSTVATAAAQSIVNLPAAFRLPQGLSITLV